MNITSMTPAQLKKHIDSKISGDRRAIERMLWTTDAGDAIRLLQSQSVEYRIEKTNKRFYVYIQGYNVSGYGDTLEMAICRALVAGPLR